MVRAPRRPSRQTCGIALRCAGPAEDHSGLPQTYIDVGAVESFRDEAITYAQRLSEAGVSVDLHLWGVPDGDVARRPLDDTIAAALDGPGSRGRRCVATGGRRAGR